MRLALAMATWCAMALPATAAERLTLAVFAYRPKPVILRMYQPLADHLNQRFPELDITLEVLDQDEMQAGLDARRIDLLFTNPSHFVLLRQRNRLSGAIATLVASERGQSASMLGGVIIARADRAGLERLSDLRGKTIAVPGTRYLGGYQTQAFELLEAGIRLPRDAALRDVGSHDKVVETVLAGGADVGFVRTGIIEALSREGKLDQARLRVVNRQFPAGFPYLVSTRLYPEWAFAALPHVNERLARRITGALLEIEPDSPVAQAAGIHGFTVPGDYLPVENLARALRLPPFEQAPDFTFADIWNRYREATVAGLAGGAVIVLLAVLLAGANRRLSKARRRALEGEEVFRRLYEDSPHPALILRAGRYDRCNQAALELLGFERAHLIGRRPGDISPPTQPDGQPSGPRAAEIIAAVAPDRPARFDWTHCRADGSPVVVEVVLTPITLGGDSLLYCGWTDITDRARAERRMAEQAAELTRVNEELEQFAFVASHDLRQPLRTIASYLTLMRRDLGDGLSGEVAEYMDFAVDGARRMDRLIVDLLAYSRSGRQDQPAQAVALGQAVDTALANLMPAIGEAGADIRVADGLPTVLGRSGDLVRLFQNLIGNAMIYRAPDRAPVVEVGAEPDGHQARVWVRDNGAGIAAEHRERVFRIFQRLENSGGREGTGIGLAVCKKIVEAGGGRIWVESEPGRGSTFFMTLPLADAKNG